MPSILGPIQLTGQAQTLDQPTSNANKLYDRLVLNNHSPYLLELVNGGNRLWLHPFMGDVVPFDPSADVAVFPQLVGTLAGNPHHVTLEYYQVGEDLMGRSYPAMLAQFGTTLVDAPVLLTTKSLQALPHTSSMVDVTAFQSFQLLVQYEAANTGPPAATCMLDLQWFDAAQVNELWRETYEINSPNSTDCGATRIVDGMHGSAMRLVFTDGNAGAPDQVSYILFGSSRAVQAPRLAELGDTPARGLGPDRLLVQVAALSVGGGVTVQRNVRLSSGLATFMFAADATGTSYDVLLYPPSLGSGNRVYQANFTGTPHSIETIALPRRALTLFVKNNDAAAKNVFVSLAAGGDG